MALDPDFGGMVIFYGPRREAKRLALGLHRACTQRHCLLQYHHAGSERAVRKLLALCPGAALVACGPKAQENLAFVRQNYPDQPSMPVSPGWRDFAHLANWLHVPRDDNLRLVCEFTRWHKLRVTKKEASHLKLKLSRLLTLFFALALCLALFPSTARAAEGEGQEIPMLDGYMETKEFIQTYFPNKMKATNKNDTSDTKEVDVTWEIGAPIYENYIPCASKYSFRPKIKNSSDRGYQLVETGSRWITVGQNMVQIYLGRSDCEYDEETQTIKKAIGENEYTISFGPENVQGVKSCKDCSGNLVSFVYIYLPKDALVPHKNADGNTCYYLTMTITGENAENAYPVLTSTYGFLSDEEYESGGNATVISPESYLIDAQPEKAVFAIPIRIDSFGPYALAFDSNGEVLAFDGGSSAGTLTLDGSVENGRSYTVSFVDENSDETSVTTEKLGKEFFTVEPPSDEERAWAVMVIPNKYVQADEKPGVHIDESWGRDVNVGFSDGHRYFKNSLFKNSAGKFAATYLDGDMTAVISEITLKTNETPTEVDLKGAAELSVTADYQYEKLYGMTKVVYQWYQCDDASGANPQKIDGATSATYTPPTNTAGTYYYYATAKFEQFTESTSYSDEDGNPFYFYDPYGWASDTVTTSDVMTLVVGKQPTVDVEEPEQEIDDLVYGGEVAFLRFVVTVGDDPVSSEKGTVTIYSVDGENQTEIYKETGVELNETIVFTYDTLQKGLKVGGNTIRIVYTSNDDQIADASKDMIITLKPKEVQAVVTDTNITKVYDGTNKATVSLGFEEGAILADDDVTVTAPNATYDNANVGTNKTINLGTLELSGEDAEWYKVIAPTEPVTGSITGGSSSNPTKPSYPPETEDTDNGSITVTPSNPHKGDEVIITPTPEEGYEVGEVTVTDSEENEVEVTDNRDGTYSFQQPGGKVTITVTFRCTGGELCPSRHFTDVERNVWYHDYAVENGLLEGTSPTTMEPNATLIRAQLAQILYNIEDKPAVTGEMVFEDVPASEWFYSPILWANQNEIINGTSPITFEPLEDISRQDLALMLYRYAGKPAVTGDLDGFTDGDQVGDWAEEAMAWAVAEGIVQGDTPTTLNPTGTATRAEAAAMLQRFLENAA